jgi:hypothetical protein
MLPSACGRGRRHYLAQAIRERHLALKAAMGVNVPPQEALYRTTVGGKVQGLKRKLNQSEMYGLC